MPVAVSITRAEFDMGTLTIILYKNGSVLDLSVLQDVKIEYIVGKVSEYFVVGTDAEATFDTDGTDGRLNYNPPAGGWTKNCSLVAWAISASADERYPAVGEIEVRVLHPGSAGPS